MFLSVLRANKLLCGVLHRSFLFLTIRAMRQSLQRRRTQLARKKKKKKGNGEKMDRSFVRKGRSFLPDDGNVSHIRLEAAGAMPAPEKKRRGKESG